MYVPVPHVPRVSKDAKQLSERLVQVVREAKKDNKRLSYTEVCQALRLTSQAVREELGGMAQRTRILIVLGIAVATAVAAVVAFVSNR